jgi:hypothetical protein
MKYLAIMILFLQSCISEKPISITEFSTYTYPISTTISLGKERIYYNNLFLVSNFRNNKKVELSIDSFVVKYTSDNCYSANTDEIRLYFYKETSKTNLTEIKKNPREVDRYSDRHDLVYCYIIKLDGSKVREKYKNGEVIETTEKFSKPPRFKITDFRAY